MSENQYNAINQLLLIISIVVPVLLICMAIYYLCGCVITYISNTFEKINETH